MSSTSSRRRFLALLGVSAVACADPERDRPQPTAECPPEAAAIAQPADATPAGFAALADDMRRQAVAAGDQSFGAVLVRGDQVIGLGPSRVVTDRDPTAHAEMVAIRDAARRLGTADLSGSVLYSTSRPCRMCETAAHWGRVERMWHGTPPTDAGVPRSA